MILPLLLGTAAFLLYIVYDINSYTLHSRVLNCGFWAGSMMLAAATILQLVSALQANALSGPADIVLLILGAAFFLLLLYCLFFALPFQETYVEQPQERRVYDRGVYALCRHPGVLCFWGMYLCLGLAALPTHLLLNGTVYSLLNLLYVAFQDRITFPKTFCDYSEYRKKAPFIIPNKKSICLAVQTWRQPNRKEDGK